MTEKTCKELYAALRSATERIAGRKIHTPRDFGYLSMCISDATHTYISPTTLKRFWGYLKSSTEYAPRQFTLDLLSIYVGYKDWGAYCSSSSAIDEVNSDFIKAPSLYTTSLSRGNILKLMWNPNRCIKIKYMGEDMFEVVESINSKLQAGDRFCCGCFIDGEPLYLTRLVRKDQVLGAYVCGQDDGIKFSTENRGGVIITYNTANYTPCQDLSKTTTPFSHALTGQSL